MFERYIETEDFLPIPQTNFSYYINLSRVIKDNNGNIVPISIDVDGIEKVYINWIYGFKDYIVTVLIAYTFKPLYVPVEFWGKLNIVFKDLDKTNVHPTNIVWKYPIGLGADVYNGYAFIPMFSRYLINKFGHIRSLDSFTQTNIKSVFSTTLKLGKYNQHTLKPDLGPITTIKRHRLLCLAWKDYPCVVDDLVPNHVNGIKGDDRLSNLEWVTNQDNIKHAIKTGLMRPGVNSGSKVPVSVRNIFTGEILDFDTTISCARYFSKTKEAIEWRLKSKNQRVFPEGYQYKITTDVTPWRIPSDIYKELKDAIVLKGVDVKYVKTGVIKSYESQRACALELNVSEATLCNWLNLKDQPILPGLIQVKHKDDIIPWRTPDNLENEIDNISNTKTVLVKNKDTGKILEFNSLTNCAKHYGINKTTLLWRIKTQGQKLYPGNLMYKYKSDPTLWLY